MNANMPPMQNMMQSNQHGVNMGGQRPGPSGGFPQQPAQGFGGMPGQFPN